MSISQISGGVVQGTFQAYYQSRQADMFQLAKSLNSGDVEGAQQAYDAILSLGQNGPFPGGKPFGQASREHDFQAIGHALQSGDMSVAAKAYKALAETFRSQSTPVPAPTPSPVPPAPSPVPSAS